MKQLFSPINGWTKAKIIKHVKANFKGKAFNLSLGHEICTYKTRCGKKCAVGLFLPEGHPAQSIAASAKALLQQYEGLAGIMPLEIEALQGFQTKHDSLNSKTSVEAQTYELVSWLRRNIV